MNSTTDKRKNTVCTFDLWPNFPFKLSSRPDQSFVFAPPQKSRVAKGSSLF